MKKGICIALTMVLLFTLCTEKVSASIVYYGSGNYVSSAPVKPLTGLDFYVDYSAISKYGSNPFYSIFNWNGNYAASVTTVAQYPASWSSYPNYFVIQTSSSLMNGVFGETYFYNSSGTCINLPGTYPMDQNSVYKCSISLTQDESLFFKYGSLNSEYLEKTIMHEVGHVFLLKHPSNPYYVASIMNQDLPNGSTISSSITTQDRWNIAEKWGY